MERLINRGLLALGCLLVVGLLWPIHHPPQGSFQGEWLAICAFLMSGLVVTGALTRADRPTAVAVSAPSSLLVLMPLLVVILVQGFRGTNGVEWSWTLQVLIYLALAAMAAMLGSTLADLTDRKAVLATISFAWLVAALLNLLAQAIQALGVEQAFSPFVFPLSGSEHGRPYGNIAQPNLLGSLFGIALACLAWLHNERRIRAPIAALLAVLLLLGLATTASRMVLGFAPVFAMCAALLPGDVVQRKRRVLFVMAGTCLLVLLHVGLPHFIQLFNESARTSSRLAVLSTTGRSQMWPVTLEMIQHHPWLGVGPGQFARGFAEANLALGGVSDGLVHHSHNLLLQLAAEYGVPALLVFLGLVAWVGFRQVSGQSDPVAGNDAPDRLLVFAIAGILAVHSLFEFPLWYSYFLLPLAFLIGLADRVRWRMQATRTTLSVISLTFLLSLAAAGWAAWDFRSAQRLMVGFLSSHPQGIEMAATELAKERLSLYASQREYVRFMITPAEASVGSPRLPLIRSAVMRHAFPKALTRLAVVEALGGAPDRARDLIRLANVMYPEFSPSRRQDLKEACEAFRQPVVCGLTDEVRDR